MFENIRDAIFVHDLEGNIFITNGVCVTLTGFTVEELHRMKMKELLSEDNWFLVEATEQYVLSGDKDIDPVEAMLIRKDKEWIFVSLSIIKVPHGTRSWAFQCTVRDITEYKRMQEILQYHILQATRAQEEERKRISLELHDETIQELVVLSRQLERLDSKGKDLSPENKQSLKELKQQALSIIQSLRNISQDLRPATLDRLGLLPALEHLVSETINYSSIETRISVLGNRRRLPEETELVLFRITQEALTNIWRHSQATKAEIVVEFDEHKTKVTIADDGKGFSLPEVMNEVARENKLGLVGMQERAKLINAHLIIRSEPAKGTSIIIETPVLNNYG